MSEPAALPQLLVVAGPNGSGKTSWLVDHGDEELRLGLVEYLNPDMVARELESRSVVAAGREVIRVSLELLRERKSFGFETTLAGHHALNILRAAHTAGYEITLVFVATSSPDINVERVAHRRAQGGHNVPVDDIVRRYGRSFDNLEAAMEYAEHVRLIDNSERYRPHEYAQADGDQVDIREPVPDFGRAAVARLVQRTEPH